MSEEACIRCAYYDKDERNGEDEGFCRRFPPSTEGWPTVSFIDWCGEFE